ncbi:unnamed protein product, partial [Ectocarpus sp. 6 AP-2014]
INQRRQRRQATLQSQEVGNSTNSRRPSPKYSKTGSGAFSTPVVRLSKWPKNVFFASDFIADKAAAAACRKRSTGKSSRGGAAPRCRRNAGEGKMVGRGARAMGEEAPVARMKENSRTTVFRTSGGGGAFQQHSVRRSVDGEARRDASVAGDEVAFFLEESASALLLLHSRFFGGARHEEDVVCSLCTLCREAGWMGNPLGVCPGLDPLVVEEIVMGRLRRNHHTDVAWQRHSNNSGGSSRPAEHYTDDGFSFEDFYQTLADVAGVVYPREAQEERRRAKPGRAMHRLLTEGVLPLAEDIQPRHWSPRSEMLFGRPALAALRMQRDTLHELYCIYNKDTKARDGASGLNRNQFLKASMLTDLGVSPVSVTEQHAASVFDDIIRNGLPVTGPSSDGRHSWGEGAIHEASDRGDYCLMGGERNNGVSSSSRKPGGGRLGWSLFLEAMAALAVGAVKNGQSVSPRRRRNGKPAFGSDRRERVDGDDGSIREPTHAANELPPSWSVEDSSPKMRVSDGSKATRETSKRRCDRPSGHRRAENKPRTDRQGTRAPLHGMVEAVAGANHPLPYGRGFYHDSRKGMELMPTLREADITHDQASSPPRSRHSPPEQQQETTRQDEKRNGSVEPAPDTRPSRFDTATTGLGWDHGTEKARHSDGTDSEGSQRLYEQSRGKTERGVVQQPRPPENRATQGAPSTDKRYGVDSLLPESHQTTTCIAARASVDTEQSRARYKSKSRENTKRSATYNATSHGGAHPDESYHPRPSTDDDAVIDKGPASRPVLARPEEEEFWASADMSGGVRERSPVSSGAIWERSPTASAAGAFLQVVAAAGREEVVADSRRFNSGPGRRTSSATSSVVSAGPKAKGGAGSSEEASGDSRSLLSVIATADSAKGSGDKLADVLAATVNVNVPSLNKVVNTKDVAALSPAPCHGGPPSLEVAAASGGCSAPTCRVAVDLGLPSPDVEQGGGTADVILRPDPGKHSAHHVAPRGRLCAGVGGAEGSYCSTGRIESTVGRGGGENSKALRGIDTHDDRLKSVGRAARADHITMNFEAAGCSVGLFEELLEPRVVATYSRHQKELLVLFQRYRTRFGGEQSRLPLSCGEETSECVNEPGIWRFVSDFPVLRRWVQGDNILLLIVRASLQRGRQRCGKEHAGNAVGLSYFGFLEVLTRMAYAIDGQQPLHDKLLDLIHALRSEDPEGILT